MDNPVIILLWVLGVAAGVGLALLFLKRPHRGDRATAAAPVFGGSLASLGESVRRTLGSGVGEETWRSLGETLLMADLGVGATTRVLETVAANRPDTELEARRLVRGALLSEMQGKERSLRLDGSPSIVLVIGVNGTGKTTTIAKLARWLMAQGMTVVLGAADTFRAAAGEQLKMWGDRLAARVVVGAEGADPAAVAFDTVDAARAAGADVVLLDTAGRLHDKKNLMEELTKIHRVAGGDTGVDEVLLVLDATSGQNGLTQVRRFGETLPVTGIVLAKLDGTAKGGIVVAVEEELGVPVKFVGIGEDVDDLVPFDPQDFVDALLGQS